MTIATDRRMSAIKDAGCVIAWHLKREQYPCDVHHLTIGGKHGAPRRGDRFTVGINPWSHRGVLLVPQWTAAQHRAELGPSYAKEPRAFRELYPDHWLLAQTDTLIDWKDPARVCECFLGTGDSMCTTPMDCFS